MMSNADETTFSEGMIYHCITEPTRRALLFVILHYFSKGDYPVVARTGWVGVPASGRSGCALCPEGLAVPHRGSFASEPRVWELRFPVVGARLPLSFAP